MKTQKSPGAARGPLFQSGQAVHPPLDESTAFAHSKGQEVHSPRNESTTVPPFGNGGRGGIFNLQ